MLKSKKILFTLTGSIACFKACQLISELKKQGHDIQVVASKGALQFVGEMTLEGLTGKKVLTNLYESGHAMDHINLIKWADFIVTCPITANRINQLANGTAEDLIGNLFLSYDFSKSWYLVPAMNPKMYSHPITYKSIETLKSLGMKFIGPDKGDVACGDNGEGRMTEVASILDALKGEL